MNDKFSFSGYPVNFHICKTETNGFEESKAKTFTAIMDYESKVSYNHYYTGFFDIHSIFTQGMYMYMYCTYMYIYCIYTVKIDEQKKTNIVSKIKGNAN